MNTRNGKYEKQERCCISDLCHFRIFPKEGVVPFETVRFDNRVDFPTLRIIGRQAISTIFSHKYDDCIAT